MSALSNVRSAGLLLLAALLGGSASGCTKNRSQAVIAQDPQARCDELHDFVKSPRWAALAGKTTREIADLLGPPDHIGTLVHDGVTWMQIVYDCEHLPVRSTAEERAAYAKGWRLAPGLYFRNGVVAPEGAFYREVVGENRTAVPPPEQRFKEGGRFP